MEMNNKEFRDLKVLIAGCGSIGKRHARILASFDLSHIYAYDPSRQQVEDLMNELPDVRSCSSFEDGLSQKPDAVFILTPTRLHIPMAIQSIRAGSHVFLEKPLSDSMKGVDELSYIAANKKKKVMIGFCFRYHEGLLKAREMLSTGQIGRLVSIRALMGEYFPEVRPDYKETYYAKYSGAFELVHDLDLAIWYADCKVKRAYSVFGAYSDIGIEAPDVAEIIVEFEDRCVASIHLDFFQRPRRRVIELIGIEGVITVEFASWDEYTLSIFNKDSGIWKNVTKKTSRDDMFIAEDMEFLKAITRNRPVTCGIEEARKSLEVVVDVQSKGK